MTELLNIDCGLQGDPSDEGRGDVASAGTNRFGQPKTKYGYVIFVQCPHPQAMDLFVPLLAPQNINLSNIHTFEEAQTAILSGDVYTCNKRGTPECPLISSCPS